MAMSRRLFFKRSGCVTATALAFPAIVSAAVPRAFRAGQLPRHIIHLVSDGMSMGTLSCADHFSHVLRQRPLSWTQLCQHPGAQMAYVNMRSLNSLVTDSAAASSSWGGGSRVKNGAINVLPDKRELRPLYSLFQEAGWKRGLVTTSEITHATPAGFAANVADRGAAETIAVQYLDRKIDLLLGGGAHFFDSAKRKDKRDLRGAFKAQGYALMASKADLETASDHQRWLGTFAGSHLAFTVDQNADARLKATVPTLAEMTRSALRRLRNCPHFILQVEGARVDHGAHNSDAAAALYDQIALDEALDACLEFQMQAPDTLLVLTTDHGNSNLGLNGMGGGYGDSPKCLANLKRMKKSLPEILNDVRKTPGSEKFKVVVSKGSKDTREVHVVPPEEIINVVGELTGYKMSTRKAAQFGRILAGQEEPLFDQMKSPGAQLGQLLANYLGIGFTGSSHTSDYVPLLAVGPGAERFRGFIQNTDIFYHYLALAKIQFRNPAAPLLAECAPSATEAERWAVC